MAEHADLLARHRGVMPDWLALYYDEPIELVDGEGRHVTDGEGNRYLDFFGGDPHHHDRATTCPRWSRRSTSRPAGCCTPRRST